MAQREVIFLRFVSDKFISIPMSLNSSSLPLLWSYTSILLWLGRRWLPGVPVYDGVLWCRRLWLPLSWCWLIMSCPRQLDDFSDALVDDATPVTTSISIGDISGRGSLQYSTCEYSPACFCCSLWTGGKKWSATSIILVYLLYKWMIYKNLTGVGGGEN